MLESIVHCYRRALRSRVQATACGGDRGAEGGRSGGTKPNATDDPGHEVFSSASAQHLSSPSPACERTASPNNEGCLFIAARPEKRSRSRTGIAEVEPRRRRLVSIRAKHIRIGSSRRRTE